MPVPSSPSVALLLGAEQFMPDLPASLGQGSDPALHAIWYLSFGCGARVDKWPWREDPSPTYLKIRNVNTNTSLFRRLSGSLFSSVADKRNYLYLLVLSRFGSSWRSLLKYTIRKDGAQNRSKDSGTAHTEEKDNVFDGSMKFVLKTTTKRELLGCQRPGADVLYDPSRSYLRCSC